MRVFCLDIDQVSLEAKDVPVVQGFPAGTAPPVSPVSAASRVNAVSPEVPAFQAPLEEQANLVSLAFRAVLATQVDREVLEQPDSQVRNTRLFILRYVKEFGSST